MENVDKTIEVVSNWIQEKLKDGGAVGEAAISDMIIALAELIKARANVPFLKSDN